GLEAVSGRAEIRRRIRPPGLGPWRGDEIRCGLAPRDSHKSHTREEHAKPEHDCASLSFLEPMASLRLLSDKCRGPGNRTQKLTVQPFRVLKILHNVDYSRHMQRRGWLALALIALTAATVSFHYGFL